jgi:hypothetical protein
VAQLVKKDAKFICATSPHCKKEEMMRRSASLATRASQLRSIKTTGVKAVSSRPMTMSHSETSPSARLAHNLKANPEALRLYREILKTAKKFYWPNDDGEPW